VTACGDLDEACQNVKYDCEEIGRIDSAQPAQQERAEGCPVLAGRFGGSRYAIAADHEEKHDGIVPNGCDPQVVHDDSQCRQSA
jgi:hypothetical protein